ncbi:MAG: hypothetical protein J7L26_04795 [Candidatus Aminicenantes bacterium]|nr:hypothetical protein [Candidatus Aminicenantes bacterium]
MFEPNKSSLQIEALKSTLLISLVMTLLLLGGLGTTLPLYARLSADNPHNSTTYSAEKKPEKAEHNLTEETTSASSLSEPSTRASTPEKNKKKKKLWWINST